MDLLVGGMYASVVLALFGFDCLPGGRVCGVQGLFWLLFDKTISWTVGVGMVLRFYSGCLVPWQEYFVIYREAEGCWYLLFLSLFVICPIGF